MIHVFMKDMKKLFLGNKLEAAASSAISFQVIPIHPHTHSGGFHHQPQFVVKVLKCR